MLRMIKYNKIGDFKQVLRKVKDQCKYDGVVKLPILNAHGTEKIHGTNAAICYSNSDGFWVQSRERVLTPQEDNLGCAFAAYQIKDEWIELIFTLAKAHNIDLDTEIITIYYEWAGGSIQKKSALTTLGKRAMIFAHAKVSPLMPDADIVESEHQPAYWIDTIDEEGHYIFNQEVEIYNILCYDQWQLSIDFNTPEFSVNEFLKVLHDNEMNSPVGKYMGVENNILEGMVWTIKHNDKLLKFKVKGEKHANSKVRTLKPVDDVKEQKKNDLVVKVVTALRLEQAWQYFFGANNEKKRPEKTDMSDFLRWIHNDIMEECLDDYFEAGIEPKELNGKVSQIAKIWFLEQYELSED